MLTITDSGIFNVIRKLDGLVSEEKIDNYLDRLSTEIAELSQQYGAEDTGEMVGSILVLRITSTHYQVICNADHGIYNEYGIPMRMPASPDPASPLQVTSKSGKTAYRPFMRPAVLDAIDMIPLIV